MKQNETTYWSGNSCLNIAYHFDNQPIAKAMFFDD
jgi:hypothetical protein